MARVPPTNRQLTFVLSNEIAGGVIDVAQCLSLLNRKAFRQGYEYYIESWSVSSAAPQATTTFMTHCSQTWVTTNAWVKAFRTWMKSQEQLPDYDEIKGRYHDFKVKFTEGHVFVANLLPDSIDFSAAAAISATASASWQESHIQIPNDGAVGVTNEYALHVLGPDVGTSKGIIHGYAESRSRPQMDDPNVVEGPQSWMDAAFDDGDNLYQIRSDVIDENDSPPYIIDEDTAFEFYPGGSNRLAGAGNGVNITPVLGLGGSGVFTSKSAGGFIAPCGLIGLVGSIPEGEVTVILNIAAGSYKGVMARPMQDVN